MPDRAFDVGIAEMHAVVFAAGLATQGLRPFCAIYSTFLQRAYDGVVHDVALQNLPVVFCMDRAGLAGSDGPTHHGALDVPYMRAVQGMVVAAPLDEQDLRDLMFTALQHDGPFAIRYPRGEATGMALRDGFETVQIGRGRRLADGDDVAIVTYGAIGSYVAAVRERLAARGISAAHYDLRFCKPLDAGLLAEVFQRFSAVVTVEDGVRDGGAGSAVLEWAADAGVLGGTRVVRLGLPDTFVEHGTPRAAPRRGRHRAGRHRAGHRRPARRDGGPLARPPDPGRGMTDLPDAARLWLFAFDGDPSPLLPDVRAFCRAWTSHGRPVTAAADVLAGRVLAVAAVLTEAEANAGVSGCGIDAMQHAVETAAVARRARAHARARRHLPRRRGRVGGHGAPGLPRPRGRRRGSAPQTRVLDLTPGDARRAACRRRRRARRAARRGTPPRSDWREPVAG